MHSRIVLNSLNLSTERIPFTGWHIWWIVAFCEETLHYVWKSLYNLVTSDSLSLWYSTCYLNYIETLFARVNQSAFASLHNKYQQDRIRKCNHYCYIVPVLKENCWKCFFSLNKTTSVLGILQTLSPHKLKISPIYRLSSFIYPQCHSDWIWTCNKWCRLHQ
jgi:hypothetical protein